nr:rho GTPase-activating protein 21 isoform X3 [Halyomorpha halys]
MAEDEGRRAQSPSRGLKDANRRGPRNLVLRRSEASGFGFTLRHFIVYPPESYTLLGEKECDGPMDTIFVKWVRPGSPAAEAGLSTGDRLVRVNGEPTAGKTYAHVVRLIQQSSPVLRLLVLPKEEDLLQLYFSETAHNPETNQRPIRESSVTRSSSMQRASCQLSGEMDNTSIGCPQPRLSVDIPTSRRGSQDTHSSDDSLIMNRIRKSLEQKEEFLRTPAVTCSNREYYMRPGKLPTPHWPPAIPASSVQPRGFIYGGAVTNMPGPGSIPVVDDRCRLTARRPVRDLLSPPPNTHQLRMVSERARQFETGMLLADRTDLYRSELARLGSKRNVPNVAVRRKEFENRGDWRKHRESRSLDSNTTSAHQRSLSPPVSSGNRIIPVGSTKIHCDPPKDFHQPSPERKTIERPRSNSAEGVWGEKDQPHRHKAVRQDSYLAAVNKPIRSERENRLTPDSRSLDSSPASEPIFRRNKSHPNDEQGSEEDERTTRRVSYLKATWGGRINVDSDQELSDNEPQTPSPHKGVNMRKWRPPLFPDDIQRIVRLFEPPVIGLYSGVNDIPQKDQEVIAEGTLYCKVILVDGKKAHDRSWRQTWGVVRGQVLYLFKDKKEANSETPVDHERIDLSTSKASSADDYTKRRHVIRLSTPNISEILLQAESQHDMSKWLSALGGGLPQQDSVSSGQNVSPVAPHKGIMKLTTTFRNRSPTGQSPVNKTRKPSQSEVIVGSPKSKTWKGMVAKQLRRIQTGSPVSPTAPPTYPEGATIGVPLCLCPPSKNNEFVPLLVELCTSIVEERGLEIIGIYRVPGNTGAVTSLTEAVNKGLESALLDQEQRWTDVNVISSLLKLFFRNLPDCLLTTEQYPMFIAADKLEDPRMRILEIRRLVHELPDHHLETLKHLMKHLKLVVEHSAVNKMEARNLAIVFGPTLVRAGDDNMVTMVTDMSHQCRVVETLIQHADWCFSDDGPESLVLDDNSSNENHSLPESETNQQSLLLGNVHKLGGMKSEVSRRDIVSSIITAANRKMMKSKTRKSLPSTAVPSDDTSPNDKGDKKESIGGNLLQRRKESDPGSSENKSATTSIAGAIASGVRGSVLFPGAIDLHAQANINNKEIASDKTDGGEAKEPPASKSPPPQPPTSDGTILTYTGLSEAYKERIRKFEMETKAMLQRDFNKDWNRIPQITPPPVIANKLAANEGAGLAKWKQITSPQLTVEDDRVGSTRASSLDSLTESNNNNTTTNNNNSHDTVADLVSTLTDTFDAKMKSLGLLSSSPSNDPQPPTALSFRDPSLHRSFTSPNLEMKVLETHIDSSKEGTENEEKEKEEEKRDKDEVEKDDEKENCIFRLKRSESFKQREEKKEAPVKLLRRAESLNKKEGRSGGLKRSDSLTKTEKTDLNQMRRKQVLETGAKSKMKRKTGGGSERSIKRRHTVGGTKDFDKTTWLDNREREAAEEERRTSSPDLVSSGQQVVVWAAPRL